MIKLELCGFYINDNELRDINLLMPLLYGKDSPLVMKERLQMVLDRGIIVFARHQLPGINGAGKIIGMGTIVFVQKIPGTSAQIEDVIVSKDFQGRGIGKQIVLRLIDEAKEYEVRHINLTARPSGIAANHLYQSLGFKRRDTNVYRLTL